MNLYKRIGMITLLICLAGTTSVQAITPAEIDAFIYDIKNGDRDRLRELMDLWETGNLTSANTTQILDELQGIKDDVLSYLKDKYITTYTSPKNLIQSFADASVYASHSASHRANQNYKDFAFTIGAMAGFRLPGGIMNPVDDILNAGNVIRDEHDITVGANLQAVTAQFGINTSSFLLDGLYLGIRYSYLFLVDIGDFSYSAYTIGLVAHYQLIKGVDAGNGWHHGWKWRGLTVGTGLLFSKASFTGSLELDGFTDDYGFSLVKPKLALDMDVTTFTVPLEVYTSALMLWCINMHLGFGVDLAFGKNTSSISLNSKLSYPGQNLDENIEATGGGSMSPSLLNPRITLGIGLRFGAVTLDVPINYYFHLQGSGLSAGLTLGVAL